MHYFATKNTAKKLKLSKNVFLYGSNVGYANFGDIIQLKGAIKFHKDQTGLNPIVILRMDAPYGGAQASNNRHWYETDDFLYIAKSDITSTGELVKLDSKKFRAYTPMHIYGGGFLNSFWGTSMLDEVESIIDDFAIDSYVFGGQQISESVLPRLRKLFKKKKPLPFGARDAQSLAIIETILTDQSRFSFDDVTEVFQEWAGSQKKNLRSIGRALITDSIAWHFNTTGYVAGANDAILETMSKINKRFPGRSHTIMQAYDDADANALDSLQTIMKMETRFPLSSYRVINLSKLALELQVVNKKYPDLAQLLAGTKLAVTSSYHTAMFANYCDIPAFLMSFNDFYAQKQKSLGYTNDINEFLANPKRNLNKFTPQLAQRSRWLTELNEVFKT